MTRQSEASDSIGIRNARLVVWCCQRNPDLWKSLVGTELTHCSWGMGVVTDIEVRKGNGVRLSARFVADEEPQKTRLFLGAQFEAYFTLSKLPREITEQTLLLEGFDKQEAAEKARLRNIAEEKQQREAQEAARTEFASLLSHFGMNSSVSFDPASPLHGILVKLRAAEPLSEDEVSWLESESISIPLALHFRLQYSQSGDPWEGAKACRHFRDANRALEACNLDLPLKETDLKGRSAFYTSRAAARADLSNLESAEKCASHALRLTPRNDFTLNVLGRILYLLGKPEEGDRYFDMVSESSAEDRQDHVRRESVKMLEATLRVKTLKYLCGKDPERYKWACDELSKSDPL